MNLENGQQYFALQNHQTEKQGPFTADQIIQCVKEGRFGPNDQIWHEGMEAGVPLAQVSQLAPLFQAAPQPSNPSLGNVPGKPAKLSKPALFSLILGIFSFAISCLFHWSGPLIIGLAIWGIISIKNSAGMLKGTALAVIGLILGIGSLGMGIFTNHLQEEHKRKVASGEYVPPEGTPEQFKIAEDYISPTKNFNKIPGNGNSDEAREIAASFAEKMKKLRAGLFTGDAEAFSFSGGEFLTLCQIKSDSCVIMFHAPNLRKFESEAKDSLSDLAWAVANRELHERKHTGKTLAVAMKGGVLYHRIDIGKVVEDIKATENRGIEESVGFGKSDVLHQFFKDKKETPKPID